MLFLVILFTVVFGYALRHPFYRIEHYHHDHFIVSEEQKINLMSMPIYYSIWKALYELFLYLLIASCFFFYTFISIPIYNLTLEEDANQLTLLVILAGCIIAMTFRLLQLVSYKVVVSTDYLYFKTLLTERKIPMKKINSIDVVSFHYFLDIEGSLPILIPIGMAKGHVMYRMIEDKVDINSLMKTTS